MAGSQTASLYDVHRSSCVQQRGDKEGGEECELSRQLRAALQKVIERIHACHRSSVLVKHFPFLEERQGRWLESAAKQVFDEVKTLMEEDVDKVYAKYQLDKFLSTITSLRQDAAYSKETAFRPSGSPEDDMRPFLMETSLPALQEQEQRLQEMESETASLMERVSASREKLVATAERYDHEVAMFRQLREVLQSAEPILDKLNELEQELEARTEQH